MALRYGLVTLCYLASRATTPAGDVTPASYPGRMISCALCGRTMLLGEAFEHWRADGVGSEQVVCRLCEDEAERLGWVRLDRPPERRTTHGSTWHARKVA